MPVYHVFFVPIWSNLSYVISKSEKTPKDRIYEGIYIGRVEVSGCTKKEALALLEEKEAEYRQDVLTFEAGEKTAEISLGELGFEVQRRKADRSGISIWKRWQRFSTLF